MGGGVVRGGAGGALIWGGVAHDQNKEHKLKHI